MPTTSPPASAPEARRRLRGAAARAQLVQQRLGALFALALLLFNFPLLLLWDHPATVFGLPLFPTALFVLWALLIVALALVLERSRG